MSSETTVELPREGRIDYKDRAHQTDAFEAMGNDLIRALVELITNADDAYDAAGRRGPIEIEAEHSRLGEFNRVIVRDQATGMTPERVQIGLLEGGGRVSGHAEGLSRRGLHSRGAKDVSVFGKAVFKTICDGVYTEVTLVGSVRYENAETHPATFMDYAEMNLPDGQNGTEATVYVQRSKHSVPLHRSLADRLSRHVQLRDIMTDDKMVVTLRDLGRPVVLADRLRYKPPAFQQEVLAEEFGLPSYPKTTCKLTVRRSEEQFEDDRSSVRQGGILIVGRRAVFDSTYFGLEGRPGALWFSGRLECPFIDDLQDDFDSQAGLDGGIPTERLVKENLNPIPLVTRRREGLQRDHPFFRELKAAVEARLRPFVEEEEKKAASQSGGANEQTRKRLRAAALQLGAVYKELARQQELEIDDTGSVDAEQWTPVRLSLTPDAYTMHPDEEKVFSIFAWPEAHEAGMVPDPPVATVNVSLPEVATVATDSVTLTVDKREPRRLRGTVRVTAQDRLDATTIEVRLGAYAAYAVIEVVEPEPPLPADPPTRLQFHQKAYSMRVGRRRRLLVWAPDDLIAVAGTDLVVRGNGVSLRCPSTAVFEPVETESSEKWQEAVVEVEGLEAAVAKVRAEIGGQLATVSVTLTDPEGQNPFDFELSSRAPRYPSAGRAEWASPGGVRKLTILAGHPSLKRYFGAKLENQDDIECRVLVAEILADALAVDLLMREEKSIGAGLFPDANAFDTRRRTQADTLLTVAHRVLVAEKGDD